MRFNKFEIFATFVLSHFPRIKRVLKPLYYRALSTGPSRKSSYSTELPLHIIDYKEHSFFGYFDNPPDNGNGLLLVMGFDGEAHLMPNSSHKLSIGVKEIGSKSTIFETETSSFNWQQGCRAQWINNHQFIFNRSNIVQRLHNAIIVDLHAPQRPTCFDWPTQATYKDEYFLSVDYRRLAIAQPEYGYHDLPTLSRSELEDYTNDGIRKVDIKTRDQELIIPMSRVFDNQTRGIKGALHSLNHCLISPTGEDFLFIHRYFFGSKRIDNLFCYNMPNDILKPLCKQSMVSHYNWINDKKFVCFFQPSGEKRGYYIVDKDTAKYEALSNKDLQSFGDGHPSFHDHIMVTDCYPGRDRMQHLIQHDVDANKTTVIGSFYSPLKYFAEGRCDLHPRLSVDGKRLFFDSTHQGKRKLCYVDFCSQ